MCHVIHLVMCLWIGATSFAEDNDVSLVRSQDFALPLHVDPSRRDRIKSIDLYVSIDKGQNWKRAATASAAQEDIPCSVKRDGLYWYAVQVHFKDGTKQPTDLRESLATHRVQKVLVDTRHPHEAASLSNKPAQSDSQELHDLKIEAAKLREKISELELAELKREVVELQQKVNDLERRLNGTKRRPKQ